MQKRKILTLEECLELERPLTLQEAVDLPLDTYKKYLYHCGILRYLPESLKDYITENKYDYIPEHNTDYDPEMDIILRMKNPNFSETLDEDLSDEEWTEEDEIEYQENEKQLRESLGEDYKPFNFVKRGIIRINENVHKYGICDRGGIHMYKTDNYGNITLIQDSGYSYL